MNQYSPLQCDELSTIKVNDEWWFYKCSGGVSTDTASVHSEEDIRNLLSHLQGIFDNKWYVKHGNIRNGGICANALLGGAQNTEGNIMRLASNISRLGGIAQLGKKTKDNLRNPRQCLDTILELEVLSCFLEEGFSVAPYPILHTGQVPDGKLRLDNTDIFIEVTNVEWPTPENFPGINWKQKQGSKIIEKCISKVEQLPKSQCGVVIVNPPTLFDPETSGIVLESMRGFLLPDLYNRISGIIVAHKLIERSGFIKATPIVLVNDYATKRCDLELVKLAEALWKHPQFQKPT